MQQLRLDDPRVRFHVALSDELLAAIVAALISASKEAVTNCKRRHSRFPIAHVVGQDRYYALQEAFLAVKERFPEVNIHLEKHPHGSSYYVVLDLAAVRVTLAKVDDRYQHPVIKLFRLGYRMRRRKQRHRPSQTAFPFNLVPPVAGQLQVTVVYGYEGEDFAMPAFMEARFLNSLGVYGDETVDLLALYWQAPKVEVEEVEDPEQPPMRRTEQITSHDTA